MGLVMIEKIEIMQRFNFKKLNRHYECFIIDLINKIAYFKIDERIYADKYIFESYLSDNSWVSILSDLRNHVTSKIHHLDDKTVSYFRKEFEELNLFENFNSEDYSYFEKIETVYSCNINIYYSNDYQEFSIKNDFPINWIKFAELLVKLFDFDVLNINHIKKLAIGLFYDIKRDGVYDKFNNKLKLTSLEFGHYESIPSPNVIIDFKNSNVAGYFEKDNIDLNIVLNLLEKFGVYEWIFKSYQNKSQNHDSPVLDGYEWYLELVFDNSIIWNILAHNEYPDTYLCLGLEVKRLTGLDLAEIGSIPDGEIELFNYYGKMKLS